MARTAATLRSDAERIWRAGVAAVLPGRIIRDSVRIEGETLAIGDALIDLRQIERIAVVGAGKAAGAMAVALEQALGPQLLASKHVTGWVNVPGDCLEPTQRIHLHAARPPGVNEPRPEGLEGTRRILELVSSLGANDLCICLLTGGGSALLPGPVPGITLDDKIRVTQLLSGAGANIEQLNAVRRQLSLVKSGGLARACRAGQLATLVISDVPGDSLDVIASGPTVSSTTTADDALGILAALGLQHEPEIARVVEYLEKQRRDGWEASSAGESSSRIDTHFILANNAAAVDAAGMEAERIGYSHAMISAMTPEGAAEDVGRHLAEMAVRMRGEGGPDCLISGGEPTVALIDQSRRGRGGRNQQLALAALAELGDCEGIVLLSGGTDGEDGPTDAAGAIVTRDVVRAAREQNLQPRDFLERNDAYNFFQRTGGLFITGPTKTNVCDLRVLLVDRGLRLG